MAANILLVDDELEIVHSMKALFDGVYNVFTATNGSDALKILSKTRIHVLACDQRMPEMVGVEVINQARQISPNTVRLLLIDAIDLQKGIGKINKNAVWRYMTKPWSDVELRESVTKAVALSQRLFASHKALNTNRGSEILVLDDELGVSLMVQGMLQKHFRTHLARGLEQAHQIIATRDIGLVIADIRKSNSNNESLVKFLKREYPHLVPVVITNQENAPAAFEMITQGLIYRYLTDLNQDVILRTLASAMVFHRQSQKQTVLAEEEVMASVAPSEMSIVGNLKSRFSGLLHLVNH